VRRADIWRKKKFEKNGHGESCGGKKQVSKRSVGERLMCRRRLEEGVTRRKQLKYSQEMEPDEIGESGL